jgi:hypothetical protein
MIYIYDIIKPYLGICVNNYIYILLYVLCMHNTAIICKPFMVGKLFKQY